MATPEDAATASELDKFKEALASSEVGNGNSSESLSEKNQSTWNRKDTQLKILMTVDDGRDLNCQWTQLS